MVIAKCPLYGQPLSEQPQGKAPLHRDNRCSSPVFLPEGSLTRETASCSAGRWRVTHKAVKVASSLGGNTVRIRMHNKIRMPQR
jgi:hypothetical protein